MTVYEVSRPTAALRGEITLAGSKSISNRALIIQALCPEPFPITALANANDTDLLQALLASDDVERNAGPAGTTFRFLTAYLSLQPGTQILTGSERMKLRPIGVLVEALRQLGAQIRYLEKEGYPPLEIGELDRGALRAELAIPANTSSQYISALLLIAPVLPEGLALTLEGDIVSRPYIEMTLQLMQYFGVEHTWEDNLIRIPHQAYQPRPFRVEADWSAASYYYALAAMSEDVDLQLNGLFADSTQGDAILATMMQDFGVETTFNAQGVRLTRPEVKQPTEFVWDFLRCPDLAQTLAVVCAANGTRGVFTGLKTLRIKETDRIAALETELGKVGVSVQAIGKPTNADNREFYAISGQAAWQTPPRFHTYEDHRMAMAFAPLGLLGPVQIAEPGVVIKSYPDFWKDWERLGFVITPPKA